MEINFSEKIQDRDIQDRDRQNYWEEEPVIQKKKVSFNDILSNMNLIVNKHGVLQKITSNMDPQTQSSYPQTQSTQPPPLDSQVKHSYIYNKYFKDYADPGKEAMQGPRVPKTMEEYRQMVLDDRKKAIEHQIRMEQIKSKKLLFTTTSQYSPGPNPRNMQASVNHLNTMKFT